MSEGNTAPKRKPIRKRPPVRSSLSTGDAEAPLRFRQLDMNFVYQAILKWDFMQAHCDAKSGHQSAYSSNSIKELEQTLSKGSFACIEEYRSTWLHLVVRETFAVVLKKLDDEGICGVGSFVDLDSPSEVLKTMETVQKLKVSPVGGKNMQAAAVDTLVLLVHPSISDDVCEELKCRRVPPPPPIHRNQMNSTSGSSTAPKSIHQLAAQRQSMKRGAMGSTKSAISSKDASITKTSVFTPHLHTDQWMLGVISSRGSPIEVRVLGEHWQARGSRRMVLIPITSLISSLREMSALISLGNMNSELLRTILHPPVCEVDEFWERSWKQELAGYIQEMNLSTGFQHYLNTFNDSQQRAILHASKTAVMTTTELKQQGKSMITLIKGPPGTGKTTTLKGLLNLLHVREYSRYYDQVAIAIEKSMGSQSTNNTPKDITLKPRLLVTAPSNVAVDNIILKILQNGFTDGNGVRYNPRIVRVGRGQGDSVKAVSLEALVENICKDEAVLAVDIQSLKREERRLRQEYQTLQSKVMYITRSIPSGGLPLHWEVRVDPNNGAAVYVDHHRKLTQLQPPEVGDIAIPRHGAKQQPEYQAMFQRLVSLREMIDQVELEVKQREFAQRWLAQNRTMNALHNREGGDVGRRKLVLELEASILNEAHIVFTTLNTAGHDSLSNTDSFSVVIVDEAAQATEAATLVPLVFCGKRPARNLVLVGDPQQLRATAFSANQSSSSSSLLSSSEGVLTMTSLADEMLQKSLFERLETTGHSVHLLNRQYRMHPAISIFPRNVFYGGLLKDSDAVLSLQEGFHRIFPPFMFFNVLSHRQGSTNGRRSNEEEAEVVFQVYQSLKRAAVASKDAPLPGRVGILTPYREQLRLLRNLAASKGLSNEVEINTVDGYQGREKDVIILTTVRCERSGVGFLADTRRMNVALTRARTGLFVVGNEKTLRVNPHWGSLISQAKEASAMVSVSVPLSSKELLHLISTRRKHTKSITKTCIKDAGRLESHVGRSSFVDLEDGEVQKESEGEVEVIDQGTAGSRTGTKVEIEEGEVQEESEGEVEVIDGSRTKRTKWN